MVFVQPCSGHIKSKGDFSAILGPLCSGPNHREHIKPSSLMRIFMVGGAFWTLVFSGVFGVLSHRLTTVTSSHKKII